MRPADLAAAVARLLVPLAGVLFIGWSAAATLLLYFADTLANFAVVGAGALAGHFPPDREETIAERINAHVGAAGGGVAIAAIVAVPLGVPLIFMLGGTAPIVEAFADPALRTGMIVQATLALWSYAALYRELQERSVEELRLKRRFALLFLRWMVLVIVAYTGIGLLFGRYAGLLFVAIYAAISFVIEVAPDRFLRAMPGGAEDAEPPTRQTATVADNRSAKRRRKG